MANLGNAYALATTLYAKEGKSFEERLDDLYDCVGALAFGTDERKADLYAQLAEKLTADMQFKEAVLVILDAMIKTTSRHPA